MKQLYRSVLLLALLVLTFSTLGVRPVHAAMTINVTTISDNTTNDGFCSLREALSYTNGGPTNLNCGPDTGTPYTINLPAGTYNITGGELQVGAPGNRTVTINGAGAASTIINGTSTSFRVIDLDPVVAGNVDVTISNVTISGGYAQAFGGGAILGGGAGDSLILTDSIITNNHTSGANSAAGISWSPAGNVTINNTTFSNNVSGQAAGAILFTTNDGSTLSITNSTFTGNTAGAASASAGGAILLGMPGAGTPPTFIITHNTFTGNQATNAAGAGGAIYMGYGKMTLQYNRIVGNTAGVAGSGGLAVYGGTATATENWWGCNTGPGGACNGALLSAGSLTTSPYLFFRNTASPTTTNVGGASTLTASFLTDSANNPVALANLSRVIGLPVSWGATNGTLSGQQTTIQANAQATATLTNSNVCANSTGSATVDSATATATLTVQCPDLTAVKSNNVSGATVLPNGWNWTVHIANGGAGYAAFANGVPLLTDTLPDSGLTYGTPAVSGASGLTGTVTCAIDGSRDLSCTASGPVQLAAGGSFDVVFSVSPGTAGPYANPRPAGSCAVDPGSQVPETNEANNTCSNSVTVNAPPSITSADTTTFTETLAGTFTISTTPGYPIATNISKVGALPSGVTFTDNGDGTATLAGTPALDTNGSYPITITASNGVLPNATQNFTLIVEGNLLITSADNTTFFVGTPGTFTVTTSGTPIPAISRSGALPSDITFVDNGDGTATLAGTPAAGTGGVYPLVITASNGMASDDTQNFTLTVNQAPSITKSFGADTFPLNGTTTLSFTINNPNASIALTGVAFTDNLPAGLVVATPNGLSGSCGGGTITANAGNGSVSLSGATLAASDSCTFSVDVKGTTAGVKNNSVTVSSTNAGTGNQANANVTVMAPPVIAKSFGADTFPLNGTTTLSFTITNPNSTAALTGVAFIDNLPPAILVATPNGLSGSCGGGTITANTGSGSVSLSGATLAASDSCTFSVDVTGIWASSNFNATDPVTSTNGGTGNQATAYVTVMVRPVIAKSFGAASILLNGTTTLSFTINNLDFTTALTGVAFTDSLPAGLVVATPNGLSGSCGGGSITANAGSGTVSLSDATLAARDSCTFSVDVMGTTVGVKDNSVTVSSTNAGTGNTATSTVTVNQAPTITSDNTATFTENLAGTFTVTTDPGYPVALTLSKTGNLPADVTFTDNGDGTAAISGTPAVGTGGTYPITITASNGVLPDATQNFTLTVSHIPTVELSTTSLNFGDQAIGATSPARTVTVTNGGGADLYIGTLGISGGFALNNNLCNGQTLAPSGICTFDVTFSPLTAGAKTGQVSIPSDAASSPDSVSLSGNGVISQTLRLRSNGTNDGMVRESTETSGIGNFTNPTNQLITLGDDAEKRQYVGLLDFDTSSLPDNAMITSVKVQVKVMMISNGVYVKLGNLTADVTHPYFGTSPGLQNMDFGASALANAGIFTRATTFDQWITLKMKAGSLFAVNLLGHTQFRLRFTLDDSNDTLKHQIGFLSGNYSIVTDRPLLIVTYYIP